jgi:signal transduction histidine kinase/FixJ family two-component response regulator
MTVSDLKSRFPRLGVGNSREMLARFGIASVLVVVFLGCLLWKRGDYLRAQEEISEVLPLTAAVLGDANQISLGLVHSANEDTVSKQIRIVTDLEQRLASLRSRGQQLTDLSQRLGGGYQEIFAPLLSEAGSDFKGNLERYLDKATLLKEQAIGNRVRVNDAMAAILDTDLEAITSQVETVRTRVLSRNLSLLTEIKQLNAGSFVFVILLFVGMAVFIILPAGYLIRTERLARHVTNLSLDERTAALALSEFEVGAQKRVLQSVLDHVGEAVVVFDADGGRLLQNGAAKALFCDSELANGLEGWEKAVVLYDSESSLPLAPDEMPVRVALKGEVFSPRLLEIRDSEVHEPHFIVAAGYPLIEENGRLRGAIGCFRDVTESIQREMELRKAMSVAEDASKSKTEFLANMSHEIRTPLTTILGYAEVLLRPSISSQELRQHVEIIQRNGKVLMTLIDDILDVSRIESGRLNIEKTSVSLEGVLSELYSLLSSRADEKKIDFTISVEGKVPKRIFTADVRLRQILINLAGNAIKFTEKGGVKIAVRLEQDSTQEKHRVVFLVSDTGCGIPSHVIESLFSPFVQVDTKANRIYGGSGLGLSLSRRLALAMGGDVRLVSTQVGVGSSFLIEIDPGPVDPAELTDRVAVEDVVVSELPTSSREGEILSGISLLLVDDSTDNLALFANFLRWAGATVTKASNGDSALSCVREGRFDLILLDIQMPKVDGYQTIAKLRRLGYHGPVVALTAHAMASEAVTCKAAGFDDFLNKPIGERALVGCVRSVVDRFQGKPPVEMAPNAVPLRPRSPAASEKVRKIISLFVKNIPLELEGIKAACEVQNWDEVVKNTHRFRGTAGSCGFMELMDEISDFEDRVLAGDTERALITRRISKLEAVGASSVREFAMAKTVEI